MLRLIRAWTGLALCAVWGSAVADEVLLKNGDRITGKVIGRRR